MRFHLQVALVGMLGAATSAPLSASAGALGAKAAPPSVNTIGRLTITESESHFQIVERSAQTAAEFAAAPALQLGSSVRIDAALLRSSRQVTGAVE